jgi:methanol--5-hydroxybenzimidazolylcobamide Co-methyltransferase
MPQQDHASLRFGFARHPVRCGHDLVIGGGEVYPELNFTLPAMALEPSTWKDAVAEYRAISEMIPEACRRLQLSGLVVEIELLPPMTEVPEWGAEVTALLARALEKAHAESGLRSALRVTPVDLRDAIRPPQLRSGEKLAVMLRSFEACAEAGAHILSIESVGGKEVHDEALVYGHIPGIMFALGVLAPRDMEFLWGEIVRISTEHGVVPGGDSACGFANTAMQLTSQRMVPEVLAAVIRAASAVRSLVAVRCGAQGPSKDCAYEGPVLKAITGIPISMEGKSASCAHFSPVGNIAGAMCDLWSNESVQNIKLLSGYAPEAYLELLAYDCRLFNTAIASGTDGTLQQLMVDSDLVSSPQALVLSPDATFRIARAIEGESTPYRQALASAREAERMIHEAVNDKRLDLPKPELAWLDRLQRELASLPEREEELFDAMRGEFGHLFDPASYGLS